MDDNPYRKIHNDNQIENSEIYPYEDEEVDKNLEMKATNHHRGKVKVDSSNEAPRCKENENQRHRMDQGRKGRQRD